ncbi:hypothetical protein [Dyadobacter fermentans]|uniref:hypothetical protein n=1 Tax=Dyadobacter fermentans TaxID=94254 RepID=UPI001CBF8531|nr:hypothetical protein [Dyadobacter fermentans]MBZ1361469.1 hypothetical protein [Dyadobacter fermentans]
MDRNMNGVLSQYETPFADVFVREQEEAPAETGTQGNNYIFEIDSPFSRTYETADRDAASPLSTGYVSLLSELNDAEFTETLYELANEVEDTWRSKVSNELAMGSNYIPFVTRQANEYFEPLLRETTGMIDKVSEHFTGNNLADHSMAELENYFDRLEFNHGTFSPVQEQFFGKIFNKVKSAVKTGIDLAKKGVAAVGKLLPVNVILNKIKGLVKPLLEKVLKFAIGKLPQNLRPYAQTLSKKYLNLEAEAGGDVDQREADLEAVQMEFDHHIAQLVFSANESETDHIVSEYELSFENIERLTSYETGGYVEKQSYPAAREQFIGELKALQPGESPAPAIEKFLPAALIALQPVIKMALTIIGRQKVINFLAGLLAKLVEKYVPANVAKPLAASIIDVGMSAIGFETAETGKTDLAYEAIANTVEGTIQHMTGLDEAALNDQEALTMHLLEAFEQAAADHFPPQYIREELRPTKQKALWVSMPRGGAVKLYKKFTHVYEITIDPKTAGTVKTYRNLPLSNFLKDKYGIDTSKPVKAKVHIYEIASGGKLSAISRFENLPGLNARQPKAWVQLLPLNSEASAMLLKEPALGRNVPARKTATRFRATAGQRFYYLEIDGARLRIPQVKRTSHRTVENGQPVAGTESRSADVQVVLNFVKSEIRLNYYFSEEDASGIVENLNKGDFLTAGMHIRNAVKGVLGDILRKNIGSKVKIVHEAVPELYFEHIGDQQEQFAALDVLGKMAGKDMMGKIVQAMTEKLSGKAYDAVVAFFKARAAEFKTAQAAPQDGVTIKLVWTNVQGMSAIKTVISAIRGNLSLGSLSDLSFPNLTAPEVSIVADKKFD